jgi:H+-transporting ATPase
LYLVLIHPQIQLKTEDLYDKEKVDLETIDIDVFRLLQCDDGGLTDEEARRRVEIFGPNKLEEKHINPFLQVLRFLCPNICSSYDCIPVS